MNYTKPPGRRSSMPDREKLLDEYFTKGATAEDLSKQYQVSVPTIRRWLRDAKEGATDENEEKIAFVMTKSELRDFILETVRDAN
jgi:transposase